MKRIYFVIALCLAVSNLDSEMLDKFTITVIDSALDVLHLKQDELGFEKALVKDDTFKLNIVDKILHDPLYLADYNEQNEKVLTNQNTDPSKLMEFSAVQLDLELSKQINIDQKFNINKPFENFISSLDECEPLRKQFYAKLDSLELHDLIMSIPTLWSDEKDSLNTDLKYSLQNEFNAYIDTSRTVNEDRILDIIKKLDRAAFYDAGVSYYKSLWKLFGFFKKFKTKLPENKISINGVKGDILYHEKTQFGEMIIGGYSNNEYNRDFAVIVDLGGNDIYRNRAGGAIGELSNAYSAVIDLDGYDYYLNESKLITQGAGFLGFGALIDEKGNDVYRGNNYSQGVGIFGLGLLYDKQGKDIYRSGFFSQAAAHVGSGFLIDKGEEDDQFFSTIWAQGIGAVFGYGALYNEGGDDSYRTGGAVYHSPLLPNDYQSFSQGFGIGWRPRAGGGIGILYDRSGNDFYNGEVFCQGTSYWYSLGMLMDNDGNDCYNAVQYAQGAGVHLSIGSLWDKKGDDKYHSRNGVVGGTAHDFSVGMLVEENGNDHYMVSGGYGTSLTNSFALFIDKSGNDMYATWEPYSLGAVRDARGYSGCGIFLDLEGSDYYFSNTFADNAKIWMNEDWAIGIDLDRDISKESVENKIKEINLTKKDSLRSLEKLYIDASLWEVGSNREKVARAKKAFISRGMDAVEYVCSEKLSTRSGLEMRLIRKLAETYPDSISRKLIQNLNSEKIEIRKNCISLLGTTKEKIAVKPLLKMLDYSVNEEIFGHIITSLGKIGDSTAVQKIIGFAKDNAEFVRLNSIIALKRIKDDKALPTLVESLEDSLFTIRSASVRSFSYFSNDLASKLLIDYVNNNNSSYPELGVLALSHIYSNLDDSLNINDENLKKSIIRSLRNFYISKNFRVRKAVVNALWKTKEKKQQKWIVKKMKQENNKIVRAMFEQIKN